MYASQSSISATAEAYIGFMKPTDGILTQLFRNCRPIIKQKQKNLPKTNAADLIFQAINKSVIQSCCFKSAS